MNERVFDFEPVRKAYEAFQSRLPVTEYSDLEGDLMWLSELSYALENFYGEVDAEWRKAMREVGQTVD